MAVFDLSSVPIDDRPAFVDERAIKSSVPFRAGAGDRSRAVDITHASAYFGDLEVVRTRFRTGRAIDLRVRLATPPSRV